MQKVQMPKIRTNYDYQQWQGLDQFDDSKTKQAFKDECDINNIIAGHVSPNLLNEMIREDAKYGDFSEVPDYQTSLNIVSHAHSQFAALDAKIRARFENDPAQFLQFVNDPTSGEELVKMGLAIARPQASTISVDAPKAPAPSKSGPGDA